MNLIVTQSQTSILNRQAGLSAPAQRLIGRLGKARACMSREKSKQSGSICLLIGKRSLHVVSIENWYVGLLHPKQRSC